MNLWHTLFRIRHFEWALGRYARVMFTWRPRWGLGFEIDTNVDPSFQLEDEDERYPCISTIGVTFVWVSLAIVIPDDQCDDPEYEPRHCGCGREVHGVLVDACEGCNRNPMGCICENVEDIT